MIKPFSCCLFPQVVPRFLPLRSTLLPGTLPYSPTLFPLPVVSCYSSFSRPVPGPVFSPFQGPCLRKASLARWMSLEFVAGPGGEPHCFSRKCPLEIISLVRFLISLPTPMPSPGWGRYALASLNWEETLNGCKCCG